MNLLTRRPLSWPQRLLVVGALAVALVVMSAISLRLAGLWRLYVVPSYGMAPTLCPADHVVVEGVSLLWRKPLRGEVAVFDTAKVPAITYTNPAAGDWIQRVVALPGDRCQIKEGKIWINGKAAAELSDRHYTSEVRGMPGSEGVDLSKEVTVPPHEYVVLGDNTANSLDSRYWGFLPETSFKFLYLCHYYRSPDRSLTRPRN